MKFGAGFQHKNITGLSENWLLEIVFSSSQCNTVIRYDWNEYRRSESPIWRRVKVKVLPIQPTKALRVGRGIAVPYLRPRH